jgi:hypothetical protein
MGHSRHRGEMRNVYNILVGNPQGKRLLVKPSTNARKILIAILEK